MKAVLSFLVFLLAPLQLALGQTLPVSGAVYGQDSGKGLPYVSIGVKHSSKGTSSDLNGKFLLHAAPTDTLLFSSVGYKALALPASQVRQVVRLEQATIPMQEVTVRGKASWKTALVGNLKASTLLSQGGANQYAMLLQPPLGKAGVLEKVYFALQPDIPRNHR